MESKRLINFILIIGLFALAGCGLNDAFVSGYNKNINAPTHGTIKTLSIGAQTASILFFEGFPSKFSAMWIRNIRGADKRFANRNIYIIQNSAFGEMWSIVYTEVRPDLILLRKRAKKEGGHKNLIGVSYIFGSLLMGNTTSLWGDIPLSQANKKSINNPKFDKQRDVYKTIQNQLDKGISLIKSNQVHLKTKGIDIFSFHGNVDKWLRAAYTLKARYYIQVGKFGAAINAAKKGIKDVSGKGDLKIPHGSVYNGNSNAWYDFLTHVSAGFVDGKTNIAVPLMQKRSKRPKTNESGRINYYYGSVDNPKLNKTDGFFAIDHSFPVVTAVEDYLILAEAYAKKGTNQGDKMAIKYLNKARKYNQIKFYSSTYKPLKLSDFQNGGGYDDISVLQEIFNEKYLSTAFQIVDFSFCRRIDYQITGLVPTKGNKFPQRFLYPRSSYETNQNTPKIESDQPLFVPTPVNKD